MIIGILFIGLSILFFVIFLAQTYLTKDNSATKNPEKKLRDSQEPIVENKKPKYKPVGIYFATESGTASKFAQTLAQEAQEFGINARVINVEDATIEMLKLEKFAVFLVSTHFEGDPPTSARKFKDWFVEQKDNKENLPDLKYCVYALGDNTYTFFGKFGKDVDLALEKRQAIRVRETVIGSNHDFTIDDQFMEYRENFWQNVEEHIPVRGEDEPECDENDPFKNIVDMTNLPYYKFFVEYCEDKSDIPRNSESEKLDDYEVHARKLLESHQAKVVEMRDLRQKNNVFGRTFHIELELPEGASYDTASN